MEQRQARAIGILVLIILLGVAWALWTLRGLRPAPGRPTPPTTEATPDFSTVTMQEVERNTAGFPLPVPSSDIWAPVVEHDEHIRGFPYAEISIIEYAPISHPLTQIIHPYLRDYINQAGQKVNWVWRQYPVEGDAGDELAGQAAECVGTLAGNGGYWEYLDRLIEGKKFNRDTLLSVAAQVRADASAVGKCIDRKETWTAMMSDKQKAQVQAKMFTVPAFFLLNNFTGEGRLIEGLHPVSYIQATAEAMMSAQ